MSECGSHNPSLFILGIWSTSQINSEGNFQSFVLLTCWYMCSAFPKCPMADFLLCVNMSLSLGKPKKVFLGLIKGLQLNLKPKLL